MSGTITCPNCGQTSHDGEWIEGQTATCLTALGEVATRLRAQNEALLEAVEKAHRLSEGWCCNNDSGEPGERFHWITKVLADALKAAKGEA